MTDFNTMNEHLQDLLQERAELYNRIHNLEKKLENTYWNLRTALEVAKDVLPSPHPLWGFLNECTENLDMMEITLDIANRIDW
jgi:hypothetical protein